jgi:hypothetical protein
METVHLWTDYKSSADLVVESAGTNHALALFIQAASPRSPVQSRFGVVFAGAENGTAAAIGCVGEVKKHEKLQDDRFFLICKGQQRFRVVDIVRTKPYLVGRVSLGESLATATPPLAVLARRRRMSFCVSLCCLLQVV